MRLNKSGCDLQLILLLLCTLPLGGCRPKQPAAKIDYAQPLPAGQVALRKLSPAEYPDFSSAGADPAALRSSIDNSLAYLQTPSSRAFFPYLDITHDRAVATLRALRELVDDGAGDRHVSFASAVRQQFDVYGSAGAPDANGAPTGKVLFTGYFTPIYDASLTNDGVYRWPLYKRPADLMSDPANPESAARRTADGQTVPYYTRQQIESGQVAGQELVWLSSRWEAYVITVQGSARLRLHDGRIDEVGYAGSNGLPYTSPGQRMVADGVIRKQDLSLKSLRSYFQSHPGDMDRYLWLNQRTVFFTERPGGPFGSLNVPVTPMASIATDKGVYPRAMPAFLMVRVPGVSGETRDYRGIMLDQDTGGAIRAAGRCDIYMGVGPQAERLAGHQLHAGKLYYLALKPQLVARYPTTAPTR